MPLKQIIIAVIILLAALFAGGWLKSASDKQVSVADKTSSLTAAEKQYDFGSVPIQGGKVSHIFNIKNNLEKKAVIKKLYTSCMCTEASIKHADHLYGPFGMPGHGRIPTIGMPLDPNEEVEVEVVFDPAAHGPAGIGPIERTVTVETDDGKVELQFKAIVVSGKI